VVSVERRQVAATWVVILVDRLPGGGIEVVGSISETAAAGAIVRGYGCIWNIWIA
jgi:hypothetical protein